MYILCQTDQVQAGWIQVYQYGQYRFGSGDALAPPFDDVLEQPSGPLVPISELPPVSDSGSQAFGDGRPHVVTAVPSASEAPWSPGALVTAGLLAVAMVLLIVFPSELFNSTLDEHHDEIVAGLRRRLPWLGAGKAAADEATAEPDAEPDALSRGWVRFVGVTAATALLYGLLDPGFGTNRASLVLVVGVGAGVAMSTLVSAATTGWLARKRFGQADYWFKVLPATLLIAALCVVVSRLVGFLPGYLYGLIGGLAFRKALDATDEARTIVISSVTVLAAAILGWLAYGAVAAHIDAGATGLVWVVAEAILAGTFIAGVGGLLGLLAPPRRPDPAARHPDRHPRNGHQRPVRDHLNQGRHMPAQTLLRLPAATLCLLLAVACGGSADGSGNPTTSSPTGTEQPATDGEDIDLASVDACSLLDVATVQALTGESVDFMTQDMSDGVSSFGCFWGATEPGIGAYVEITWSRAVGIDEYTYGADQGCSESPVEGVGVPAEGGTCPANPQAKVYLAAYDRGVRVMVLVNDPSRPLTPGDLAGVAKSVVEEL
jgi:hypothetical protein